MPWVHKTEDARHVWGSGRICWFSGAWSVLVKSNLLRDISNITVPPCASMNFYIHAGYRLFNWSTESSTKHDSILINGRRDAIRVSFGTIFFFFFFKFLRFHLLILPSEVLLNDNVRYAKSRMGMRKRAK